MLEWVVQQTGASQDSEIERIPLVEFQASLGVLWAFHIGSVLGSSERD